MNPRALTLLFLRFLVGGSVIAVVSLISAHAPRLTGLLAGFPAVFLTALLFIHGFSGTHEARKFSSTAVYGMAGSVFTVLAVIVGLTVQWPWPLVVVVGAITYIGFVMVMVIRQKRLMAM